ncbi:nitroreductase family protein [uncultured Mitsuokella sp.]|uniref:nitroreductase family protein n=1 Tax=uncultured Mitsuokella sp. TaxID=453120 RepID=UPI002624FFF7|nr:nitroreductase family protein [uncultured Mitsuokella sp.]
MTFLELAKKRYSCRSLQDRPVEEEKLHRILEAGNLAPTAVNKQPIHFWVLKSSEAMKKLAETTHFVFGAPVAIVIGSKAEEAWVRSFDEKNFAEVDASIAATHMMLEAEDLGLGTTWVGHFDAPKMKKLFPEMAGFELSCVLPIGYPTDDAAPSTRHAERKGTEALVSWL